MAAERRVRGEGVAFVALPRDAALATLLDPATLRRLVPGADAVERVGQGRYRAVVSLGVGPLRLRQTVELRVAVTPPGTAAPGPGAPIPLEIVGSSSGALARGHAVAAVRLDPAGPGRTRVAWRYEGTVAGAAALAGGAALSATARVFVGRFFANLGATSSGRYHTTAQP